MSQIVVAAPGGAARRGASVECRLARSPRERERRHGEWPRSHGQEQTLRAARGCEVGEWPPTLARPEYGVPAGTFRSKICADPESRGCLGRGTSWQKRREKGSRAQEGRWHRSFLWRLVNMPRQADRRTSKSGGEESRRQKDFPVCRRGMAEDISDDADEACSRPETGGTGDQEPRKMRKNKHHAQKNERRPGWGG